MTKKKWIIGTAVFLLLTSAYPTNNKIRIQDNISTSTASLTHELNFEDETISIGFEFEGVKKIAPATGNKGPLTYKLGAQKKGTEDVSYFSISDTTLNIRDNTPAGTYTLSITATDAGNSSYNSASKTKTVTLILKSVIVKFDGNGHTAGQMEDFLPSVTYYKTGYTFVGWKAPDKVSQTPSSTLGDYPSDVVYSKDNKYYYNNSLAEGLHEGKEYTSGELTNGTKNSKEYSYGELLNGFKDGKLYVDGVLFTGNYGVKYVDGQKFTGIENSKYYKDGVLATGNYSGYYYENGVQQFPLSTNVSSLVSDIENAINQKAGTSGTIAADDFASKISEITTDRSIDATAKPSDLLQGRTAYSGGRKITGTMPQYEYTTITIEPGRTESLGSGYYKGITIGATDIQNTGTYTFASGSTGSTVDMGVNNTYRYVNASNVYDAGKKSVTISDKVISNGAKTSYSTVAGETYVVIWDSSFDPDSLSVTGAQVITNVRKGYRQDCGNGGYAVVKATGTSMTLGLQRQRDDCFISVISLSR